ncbi:extracellular calcium-sensing receptor-like [Protopterus annectens]|uniref:extracellular calcium-sensing receptor-like n=1 Tax=Protopterus annectens TaxID=7888 RepID=UPI001CFB326F|nr:extracellular calcium-sensing receptor-like [Protopterus annectens]
MVLGMGEDEKDKVLEMGEDEEDKGLGTGEDEEDKMLRMDEDDFTLPLYQMVQGMIFAIAEINRNPYILQNVTLGFGIYDSCDTVTRALEGTLWSVSGQIGPVPNYNCKPDSHVAIMIGDSRSQVSIPMARVLGLYRYPQISYGSGALSLNDKHQFPSFLRTVPSSYLKYDAVARMLLQFGWTWVGLLAEDDDYGQEISQVLKEQFIQSGICIEFFESLPVTNMELKMEHLVELVTKATANVVLITSSDSRLYPLMAEIALQNVTGKIWIGSEEWPISLLFSKKEFFWTLQGTLWFSVHRGTIPGFQEHLYDINPLKSPEDIFTMLFWEEVFGCKWNNSKRADTLVTKRCTGSENIKGLHIPFFDPAQVGYSYNVYIAVYAAAYALHNVFTCRHAAGPFQNGSCANTGIFLPWQLFYYIKNVRFFSSNSEEMFFDQYGNPPDVYDILNWQMAPNGTLQYATVGKFDSRLPVGQDLVIHSSLIIWNRGNNKIPKSVCTESCQPGYRKATQPGKPVCCFACLPCSGGEISNKTDATECLLCPFEFWSNDKRDLCIKKHVEFLSFSDILGAPLSIVTAFSSLIPAAILIIFIRYRETPVVKANNRELSYLLLLSLILSFLCSLIFIGQPNTVTCMLRQITFGIIFVLSVSCVLAKTVMVVIAFKATNPNSPLRNWVGSKLPNSIVCLCSVIQGIICISWIISAPPFPELNTKSQNERIIIQCNEGSAMAFWCMLGYMGFLSIISFVAAFLARNLPDSFNEAKYITFSMIVFVSVWLSFIPAYLSTQGRLMVAVEIFAIYSSSAGVLACIFFPKCYIIIFKSHMNSRDFLMGKGVQKHIGI